MDRVLVWGLGISGKSAVKLLKAKGYEVYAGDDKDETDFREYLDLVDTVVLSPGIPPRHPLWIEAQKRGLEVIGEMELAYRFFKGRVVAITGTDGKSTVTRMTYLILKEHFGNVLEGGNTGTAFSEIVLKDPFSLAVLEVSSFQGKTLKTFRPHGGAFLNFARDHLDWHTSLEDYLHSKYNIFRNQQEEDFVVLYSRQEEVINTPTRAKKYFFSSKDAHGFLREGRAYFMGEELFEVSKLKIYGHHNYRNALASAMIAKLMGVPSETVRKVLYEFSGLPFRLELLGEWEGVKVFNDSKATTVNALESALKSMPDKSVILIAGGRDKGGDFESLYDLILQKVRLALLIGEAKDKIFQAWRGATILEKVESLEEALKVAKAYSQRGDIILFSPACASFDMFKDYIERGQRFSELVYSLFGQTSQV
ncbi:MAG: UDP-N-acetylmuramoyl-L-alanine--D-glutamate ligase [Hydrogenobacter thermophilus]|uniref:UDP-N-acetylmuramoyl-L-alanine--D-glutamate ligase n=1 Tax=Hydrogenobacter thermophilus TaxID=940 RepID=UPI001C778037|nr:UDP-N-acetylmuramoyl-L-alanine--D-glutamate ligase [Hydrogenobacter thermophilus]QWK19480.1 MAG: UDP-N-acetylmuramoyl-L-alanine--D-glutamate ligase [Hydrogenobacter thermophilus]